MDGCLLGVRRGGGGWGVEEKQRMPKILFLCMFQIYDLNAWLRGKKVRRISCTDGFPEMSSHGKTTVTGVLYVISLFNGYKEI